MSAPAMPPRQSPGHSPPAALEITDVRIRVHTQPDDSAILKAFATVTLMDVFVVHDLKLLRRPDRYFVSMPACLGKNGRHRDIAHPIDHEWRSYLERAVVDAYLAEARGDHAPVEFGANGDHEADADD